MSAGTDFSKAVEAFSKKFGIDALTVVQKTAVDIHTGIVEGTPRDTGRAAASWNLTKDEVDLTVAPEVKKGGASDHKNIVRTEVSPLDVGKDTTFYVSNNLPYIGELERGHSDQAPDGWVRQTIARFKEFIIKNSR